MPAPQIPAALVARLYREANAERWSVSIGTFAETLEASAERAFRNESPRPRDIERYLSSLHLDDLALACACASGNEQAWEHFVREHRPVLYRAAEALDPS